jgi:hypothetical protein
MNNLDYGRRLTTDLIIEGKLKFLQFSESSYAAVYLISEDSQTYVKYILSMDQAEQDCWVYVYREHVGTTFKSTQTKSGITTVDVWYPFKLVFTTNNHFEIWVNSGSGMELILREKDRIRVGPTIQDFDNLRLYTRGVEVGFDDILLKAESLPYCGISGTYYFPADINQDCRVDFEDFAEIVQNWLECTSPLNQNCRPYSN